MKSTQHKLIALLAVFIFFACATTKKVEETSTKAEVKTETEVTKKVDEQQQLDVKDKTETATDKTIEQNMGLSEELESRLITYDTSKPVDPLTGRSPVKSELIQSKRKQTQQVTTENVVTSQKNNITTAYKASLKSKVASQQKIVSKIVDKTSKVEKTVPWWMYPVGILIFIGLIWVLFWFKPYKDS